MPKSELRKIILHEIEQVFGRRIVSSRDCIELSDDIFQKTKYQLNPNTLRRFFALIKAEYPPSHATLMILAKYCGFQNLEDIFKIKKSESEKNGSIDPDSMLAYLVSMFQDGFVKEDHDETFVNLVIHSIKFLNSNKFLTDRFQSQVAKTRNGLSYYFEQLVNIDKLNSFYGNGLRYYLREKGTLEAEIFTAAISVFKYWLTGEDLKLVQNAELMIACEPARPLHPYLEARELAALLFYYQVTKTDSENLRITISNFLSDMDHPDKRKYRYLATYIVCEALLLTGYAGDTLFYIKQIKKSEPHSNHDSILLNYTQNYQLLEACALYQLSENKQAERKMAEIKSSEFQLLNKKFSGIIYLTLSQQLKSKEKKHDEQIAILIHETGFERLSGFMPMGKSRKRI